jgi:hypothetical protein
MTLINLREIPDEQTIQDRSRLSRQTYQAEPDERIDPSSDPVARGRRLDVDAVLARSLPRTVEE